MSLGLHLAIPGMASAAEAFGYPCSNVLPPWKGDSFRSISYFSGWHVYVLHRQNKFGEGSDGRFHYQNSFYTRYICRWVIEKQDDNHTRRFSVNGKAAGMLTRGTENCSHGSGIRPPWI